MSSSWPLDGSEYPSWTNNVSGNPLDISQYVTWIPAARVATRLVPLYCRLKKGNGRGISHISKVPSVVLDGMLKKNPAPVGAMNCGARQFFVKQSIPRSRPLGVAWRYGIVWPASRRACRIGPQVRCTMVSWDDLHWCLVWAVGCSVRGAVGWGMTCVNLWKTGR